MEMRVWRIFAIFFLLCGCGCFRIVGKGAGQTENIKSSKEDTNLPQNFNSLKIWLGELE